MEMTIFLDEKTVMRLVGMKDALEATEEVFREAGKGNVTNVPRVRVPLNEGTLRITAAVLNYRGYYGVKVSSTTVFGHNAGRVFCLYKEKGGQLCAIVQVFALGALRTGAASGVATHYLSNPGSSVLGVIGSGRQAQTQVEAIAAVRAIKEVRTFSRSPEKRTKFCQDIKTRLGIDALPGRLQARQVLCVVRLRPALQGRVDVILVGLARYIRAHLGPSLVDPGGTAALPVVLDAEQLLAMGKGRRRWSDSVHRAAV